MRVYLSATLRLACFACLLIPASLFAQDFRHGYIIKNNGDSLRGYVEYTRESESTKYCKFRAAKRSKATKFSPNELRGYGFYGDKQYESMEIPKYASEGNVFLRVLVKGPMYLYQYQKEFLLFKDSLVFLPSPKDEVIVTYEGRRLKEDSRYKGILNFMISECKMSADETRYTQSDLTNIVTNYNRCQGVEPAFKKPKPFFKVNYSIFGGYAQSEMSVDNPESFTFNKSSTGVVGAGLDISSPRIFDRFFITTDLSYVKNLYQAYYTEQQGILFLHHDVSMDFTSLRMPVGLRYNFLKESSTPYIKGGMIFTFILDSTIEAIEERETAGNIVITEYTEGGYEIRQPKGFWMGVGYSRLLLSKLQIYVELRYDTGEGFVGTSIQRFSTMKNYSFLLGLRF